MPRIVSRISSPRARGSLPPDRKRRHGILWSLALLLLGVTGWLEAAAAREPPPSGTIFRREEPDGSISFTDNPERYASWGVFVEGRSRSGSRFKDYLKNVHRYDDQIRALARTHAVPAALIKAVVMAESAFNPRALSPKGAQGLMQLMPGTARLVGVTDPWDPQQNLEGGTLYLKQMLLRFGNDQRKAVAAYNAGPGAVEKYRGVPPFAETREYVRRVELLYETFQANDLALAQR